MNDQAVSAEVKSMFGGPSSSAVSPRGGAESFAARAEHLCNRVLSTVTSGASRRRRRNVPYSPKEVTKSIVLIDWQGDGAEPKPLYDYQKLFDGIVKLAADMSEIDVRVEILRLIKLKNITTHQLGCIAPDSFEFVRVKNRRVRPLDGDVPFDANSLSHTYKHGNIYIRLKDCSLWCKQVCSACMVCVMCVCTLVCMYV